jgi:hypothetical protein
MSPAADPAEMKSNAWTLETSGTTANLNGVVDFIGHVCAVGDGGVATCLDDPLKPAWKPEPTGTKEDLLAVGASDEIIAVGRHGTILARRRSGWVANASGVTEDLYGIAGEYAVGAKGTILFREHHGMDSKWIPIRSGTTEDLYAVATNLDDVMVVGAHGTILHQSDPRIGFRPESSGTTTDLRGVAEGGGYGFNAVGVGGVVLVKTASGGAWRATSEATRDLRAVALGIPTLYAVGDRGTILSHRY